MKKLIIFLLLLLLASCDVSEPTEYTYAHKVTIQFQFHKADSTLIKATK